VSGRTEEDRQGYGSKEPVGGWGQTPVDGWERPIGRRTGEWEGPIDRLLSGMGPVDGNTAGIGPIDVRLNGIGMDGFGKMCR